MKIGLFGGAVRRGETADSASYGKFVDYVRAADRFGYASIFIVEHHFSGIGQVSSSLNLLSYLAAKTETIATLKSLGASGGLVFRIYLLQVSALAPLGIALRLVAGALHLAGDPVTAATRLVERARELTTREG